MDEAVGATNQGLSLQLPICLPCMCCVVSISHDERQATRICLAFSHNTLFLSVFCAWYFLRKGLFLNFVSFQICPVHFCCLRVTVLPLLTRPVPFVSTFAFFSVHDISNILFHIHIFTISCLRLPKVYLVTTANFVGKRQIKDQEVTTWITCLHGIIQTSNYT